MTRDEVLERLRQNEADLRRQGIVHAALFGSVARGEAGPGSDIDILIDIDPEVEAKLTVYGYVGIKHAVEDLFSRPVDVVDRTSMRPHVRMNAEREAVYAF